MCCPGLCKKFDHVLQLCLLSHSGRGTPPPLGGGCSVFLQAVGMSNYRKGSHSVFSIHLHMVWITRYRKKILSGDIAQGAMSLIRGICEKHQVEIFKGHIAPDHIHLFVSIPPNLAVSKLTQQLKGRTSHAMINEFPLLGRQYWGHHMWARGCFCCSSGNVTDEVIR